MAGLDGLRGIAVLMVMSTHLLFVYEPRHVFSVFAGGFLGVELFFVLSGFLITSLLIVEQGRSGRISLRGFYTRRALRLLPAVVVLLAVHLIYAAITGLVLGVEIRSVLEGLFYASNWFLVTGHPFAAGLQHLWSLSVEEQFYVVWPILTVGMLAWRWSRTYAVVIIVAVIGALTVHTYVLWRPGTNFLQINVVYARTDVQAVCLLAGAAAAYVWSRHALPLGILSVLATVSVVFIAVCTWYLDVTAGFYYQGGLTLIGIAGAVVVLAVVEGGWRAGRVFTWGPLRAVGRVSYGLYLWHLPVFFEVHRHSASLPTAAQIGIALSLTTACTVASWRFVETPFLRRKQALSADRTSRRVGSRARP